MLGTGKPRCHLANRTPEPVLRKRIWRLPLARASSIVTFNIFPALKDGDFLSGGVSLRPEFSAGTGRSPARV